MRGSMLLGAIALILGGATAGGIAAQQTLSPEQMAVLNIDVETFQISLACNFRRDHSKVIELVRASGARTSREVASDYFAMRMEIERSTRSRTRSEEYCATGWWKYGANGTVAAGLLSRPPPLSDQPALTPEQESILRAYVQTTMYGPVCPGVVEDSDARVAYIETAALPHGFGKGTLAWEFLNTNLKAASVARRAALVDVDGYCADGWARFGPEGTEAAGLLVRRE